MQDWVNIVSVIAGIAAITSMLMKALRDIRDTWRRSASVRPFLARNWFSCTCVALGFTAILAVLMLPLSPLSVALAAVGALFAAVGAASMLVMESGLAMIDRVCDFREQLVSTPSDLPKPPGSRAA